MIRVKPSFECLRIRSSEDQLLGFTMKIADNGYGILSFIEDLVHVIDVEHKIVELYEVLIVVLHCLILYRCEC